MSYLAGMRSLPIALRLVECARARHKSPCGGASGGATRSPGPNEPPPPPHLSSKLLMPPTAAGAWSAVRRMGVPSMPLPFQTKRLAMSRDASER